MVKLLDARSNARELTDLLKEIGGFGLFGGCGKLESRSWFFVFQKLLF